MFNIYPGIFSINIFIKIKNIYFNDVVSAANSGSHANAHHSIIIFNFKFTIDH
jgi:hypothetical protein